AQFGEILDDAVVHDRDFFGGVGMSVVLGWAAMRRPACVADADRALKRLARKPALEILQFAPGAAPRELTPFDRGYARSIVAAIFEALERLDELRCRRLAADDANNSAHASCQVSGYQEKKMAN